MHRFKAALLTGLAILGGSDARAQDSARIREFYHIFDFKTDASKTAMVRAALAGMSNNIGESETVTPIVMESPPEQPSRFKIINSLENSPMAAMMGMVPAAQLAQFKQARCDGAIWIANAVRKVHGSQYLRLTMCLFPYKSGYQLDIYGIDSELRGGGISARLGRAIGTAISGKPEDWTNKTIVDIVRALKNRGPSQVKYIEGQPEFVGTPWDDQSYVLPTTEKTKQD